MTVSFVKRLRLRLAVLLAPKDLAWVAPWEMTGEMWEARRAEYRDGRTYNDGWRAMRDAHMALTKRALWPATGQGEMQFPRLVKK